MDALWIDGLIDGRSDTPAYKGSIHDRIAPETSMTASPKRVECVDDVAEQESCSASIQRRAVSHKNSPGSPPPYPLPPTPCTTPPKPVIVQLVDGSNTQLEANDASSDSSSLVPRAHSLPLWAKAFDPLALQGLSRSNSSNIVEDELEKELFQGLKFLDGPFPAISRSVSSNGTAPISAISTTISSPITVTQKPSSRSNAAPHTIKASHNESASYPSSNKSSTLPPISPIRLGHAYTPSDTSTGATISTVIRKVAVTPISRPACLPSSPSLPLFASPTSTQAPPSLLDDLPDMSTDFANIADDWIDSVDPRDTAACSTRLYSTCLRGILPAEEDFAIPNESQIRVKRMSGSEVAVMRLTQYSEKVEKRDNKDRKRKGKVFSR
ncbi:hypothetical protein SISNIDRAFT_526106 [Sistotremastrum niveocremeum HHB9708]|uniref:Uncharacterized protein n=1 Tax=Sistotremastrum niveocremeum HHB9708 TaxID=1314777 RepID=A0A164QLA2_9AGAM|nr:hypothetical protein SISNIDRAFT_526106 [Sistotremastrum niveocremeum HHB9708]